MLNDLATRICAALMNRKGVTAAEYAVLAVGIVIVVAGAAALLGTAISNSFGSVVNSLTTTR